MQQLARKQFHVGASPGVGCTAGVSQDTLVSPYRTKSIPWLIIKLYLM